ncbi:AbfB domain-containing protein [Streptomyces sp. NPDC002701]|uniref:AbfB domain-containing protein n=1 Tax=Streptomyces sp. NPDC002701 TaxID=3364661 RepID=UPI003687D1B6
MPERTTESAPDPSAHLPKVWETGEALEEPRIPGTRRLWAAAALLVAVLASVVTVTVLDTDTDASSRDRTENTSATDEPFVPGPPTMDPAPSGKSGLAAPEPAAETTAGGSASPAGGPGGPDSEQAPRPSASKPASGSESAGRPPASTPSSSRKSVQSVSHPDRHWRLGRDSVRLDHVDRTGRTDRHGSSRAGQGASFRLVPGLADAGCVSFSVGDGRYLRHFAFRLRADHDDGSALFEQDATFCPRPTAFSGAVMLESVNYRGHFLRHRDFRLRLDPYEDSRLYRADSAFRLVKSLG